MVLAEMFWGNRPFGHALHDRNHIEVFVASAVIALFLLPLAWILYRFLLRVRVVAAILLSFGVLTASLLYLQLSSIPPLAETRDERFAVAIFSIAFSQIAILLLAGLGIKLYLALIGHASPAELTPGAPGLRAWLRPFHMVMVVLMTLAARFSLDWSLPGTFMLGAALLLAFPLLQLFIRSDDVTANVSNDPAGDERERVLKLLEAGKINAEEAAELINALGPSDARAQHAHATTRSLARPRILMLAGALVIFFGFLLPWFSIDVGQAMQEAMGQSMGTVTSMMRSMPGAQVEAIPDTSNLRINLPKARLNGGDISYGLGWIILATAVAAAVLPLLWPPDDRNRATQRTVTIALAATGSALFLYVVVDGIRYGTVGLFIVAAGFALLWLGTVQTYLRPAASPRLAVA